jgi:hypothetical protein
MSPAGRDFAKGSVVTLIPTGMGFILSGWVVGVICLFVAGGLSLVLWTPLGRWLGFHATDEHVSAEPERPQTQSLYRGASDRDRLRRAPGRFGGRVYGGAEIGAALRRWENEKQAKAVFVAVEAEISLAYEEALELMKMLAKEPPHTAVEAALAKTVLPDWRAKMTEFIGVVLGSAQRSAFKGAGVGGNELKRLESESQFLSGLALNLSSDSVRIGGQKVLEARHARRSHEAGFLNGGNTQTSGVLTPASLADQLDALMREGMALLGELMVPAQAEETNEGEWALEFGDAPVTWRDKANAFYKKSRDLLVAEKPALLPDFERGYNERLRIQREREQVASQQPDRRSRAQKMLDFATDTQRTPAKVVEACLEGLAQAQKSI